MTEERPPEPVSDDTAPVPTPPPASPPASEPPAYTPPTYTPPPAAAQPTVAWAPPPVVARTAGQRTGLSLGAGILLLILGILGALLSLAILTIGREAVQSFNFENMPGIDTGGANVGAIAGSAVTFVGIVLLVFSVFYVLGGIGVVRSRDWGRVIGIIVGILAGLFWLAGVAGGDGSRGGIGFALILLIVHAYIAIALLFFWRTRAPA